MKSVDHRGHDKFPPRRTRVTLDLHEVDYAHLKLLAEEMGCPASRILRSLIRLASRDQAVRCRVERSL